MFETANNQIDTIINLTEKSIREIKKIKEENNLGDEYSLRVGVKGGGCSGFSYSLGFEKDSKQTDIKFNIDGINVLIDTRIEHLLRGTILDFSDGLQGRGFVFNNPNAKKTCGCGNSFGC